MHNFLVLNTVIVLIVCSGNWVWFNHRRQALFQSQIHPSGKQLVSIGPANWSLTYAFDLARFTTLTKLCVAMMTPASKFFFLLRHWPPTSTGVLDVARQCPARKASHHATVCTLTKRTTYRASCRRLSKTVSLQELLCFVHHWKKWLTVNNFTLGLMTDRVGFIKLVRNEGKRFRPLGKFITEFTR